MDHLDIEKLERKNIYRCPDNAFAEMQSAVLQTLPAHAKGRIFKMQWAYAAAAAVVLLFGLTLFLRTPAGETPVASDEATIAVVQPQPTVQPTKPAAPMEKNIAATVHLTSDKTINQKDRPARKTAVKVAQQTTKAAAKKAKPITAEQQMEQVLAGFPSAELADLGRNAETDVYLDLYN